MSIISGISAAAGDDEILLPIESMVGTRDHVNAKAGTRRMLSHGLVAPNDPRNLDMMEWQAKDLKIDSWKGYRGRDQRPLPERRPLRRVVPRRRQGRLPDV